MLRNRCLYACSRNAGQSGLTTRRHTSHRATLRTLLPCPSVSVLLVTLAGEKLKCHDFALISSMNNSRRSAIQSFGQSAFTLIVYPAGRDVLACTSSASVVTLGTPASLPISFSCSSESLNLNALLIARPKCGKELGSRPHPCGCKVPLVYSKPRC